MPIEESKVFISYSRTDSDFAARLGKDLKSKGLNIWLDQINIKPSDRWDREVENALKASTKFLIILTPSSVSSDNVMDELSYALKKKKIIIPVLYIDCEIPFRIDRIQHSDFTKAYDKGFNNLLRAFDITDETSERDEEVERKHKPEGQRQRKKEPTKGKPVLKKNVTKEIKNSFTDPRDGIIYRTVKIGDQIWMAENLKATKFNDGTDIQLVSNDKTWIDLSTRAYCWYDNEESMHGSVYGALYNWHAVNTGKLCPTGWHVPTDEEWKTLIDHLGGKDIAGGKLKETGTKHWISPNEGAINESGFAALPGGARYDDGIFNSIGTNGHWWSATERTTYAAWLRYVYYGNSYVTRGSSLKGFGFSVRCVRD